MEKSRRKRWLYKDLKRSFAMMLSIALVFGSFQAIWGPQEVKAAPQVSGLSSDSVLYAEGSDPKIITPDIAITEDGAQDLFADGYLKFEIEGGSSPTEILSLKEGTYNTSEGEISVAGGVISLDGKQIGSVNAADNGVGGALQIDFSTPLENGDFSQPASGGNIPGWTINTQSVVNSVYVNQIWLGDLASKTQGTPVSISGTGPYTITGTVTGTVYDGAPYSFVTAANYDPASKAAWGNEGVERSVAGTPAFNHAIDMDVNTGVQSLRLWFNGTVQGPNSNNTFGTVFGPEAISAPFTAKAGDLLSFDWQAANGDDHYEVYGFLRNVDTGEHTELLYGRGTTQTWTTASGTIPADGTYQFRFVAGSYDASGAFGLGASLYIDNIRVLSNDVTSEVVQAVARLLTYANSDVSDLLPDSSERKVNITAVNTDRSPNGSTGPRPQSPPCSFRKVRRRYFDDAEDMAD